MDVWDYLALLVGGHIIDPVADVHMPVDPFRLPRGRISATRLDDHPDLAQGVLFIIAVMGEDFELAAVEFLRPVTLLAGFLRRAQISYRRGNRPRKRVEYGGEHLSAARQL